MLSTSRDKRSFVAGVFECTMIDELVRACFHSVHENCWPSVSRSTTLWRLRNRSSLEVIAVLLKSLKRFLLSCQRILRFLLSCQKILRFLLSYQRILRLLLSRRRTHEVGSETNFPLPQFHLQYSCLGPVGGPCRRSCHPPLDARCRSLVDFVAEDRRGALAEQCLLCAATLLFLSFVMFLAHFPSQLQIDYITRIQGAGKTNLGCSRQKRGV